MLPKKLSPLVRCFCLFLAAVAMLPAVVQLAATISIPGYAVALSIASVLFGLFWAYVAVIGRSPFPFDREDNGQ
jgi:hypothetical protein